MPPTGPQLRARRLALDIPLIEIAALLGISAPYLWDLEQGNRPMDAERRRRYERALVRAEKRVKA